MRVSPNGAHFNWLNKFSQLTLYNPTRLHESQIFLTHGQPGESAGGNIGQMWVRLRLDTRSSQILPPLADGEGLGWACGYL